MLFSSIDNFAAIQYSFNIEKKMFNHQRQMFTQNIIDELKKINVNSYFLLKDMFDFDDILNRLLNIE